MTKVIDSCELLLGDTVCTSRLF